MLGFLILSHLVLDLAGADAAPVATASPNSCAAALSEMRALTPAADLWTEAEIARKEEEASEIHLSIDDPRRFVGATVEIHHSDEKGEHRISATVAHAPIRMWNPETRRMDVVPALTLLQPSRGPGAFSETLPINAHTRIFLRDHTTESFADLKEFRR